MEPAFLIRDALTFPSAALLPGAAFAAAQAAQAGRSAEG